MNSSKKVLRMKAVKCLFVLLFLFSISSCPRAFAQTAPSEPASGPVLQLSETEFNFGEVMDSKEYLHNFRVRNIGTAPLEIKKVVPD